MTPSSNPHRHPPQKPPGPFPVVPSPRLLLTIGLLCLLISTLLMFLWRDLIFAHTNTTPAPTRIVRSLLPAHYRVIRATATGLPEAIWLTLPTNPSPTDSQHSSPSP